MTLPIQIIEEIGEALEDQELTPTETEYIMGQIIDGLMGMMMTGMVMLTLHKVIDRL